MGKKQSVNLPSWWEPSLYDFLNSMPAEGWVWEFYRRAVLKENLGQLPVEAMNPDPDLEKVLQELPTPLEDAGWTVAKNWEEEDIDANHPELAAHNWMLYLPWNHPRWSNNKPFGMDLSVYCSETPQLKSWFGRPFVKGAKLVGKTWLRPNQGRFVELNIDLARPNAVLKRDFGYILRELRQIKTSVGGRKYPPPERISLDNIQFWKKNKILQVWDLREFKVSYSNIVHMLFEEKIKKKTLEEPKQVARNAHNRAVQLIEKGGWFRLALSLNLKGGLK